jgi:hypothetical protein
MHHSDYRWHTVEAAAHKPRGLVTRRPGFWARLFRSLFH